MGDVVAAVDGFTITGNVSLDSLLQFKTGKRTSLTIVSGGNRREVVLRPRSAGFEKQMSAVR